MEAAMAYVTGLAATKVKAGQTAKAVAHVGENPRRVEFHILLEDLRGLNAKRLKVKLQSVKRPLLKE